MWKTFLCQTLTGQPLMQVDSTSLSDFSWERRLNGIGSGSATFVMEGIGSGSSIAARRDSRRKLLEPWSRMLVHCWNDIPIYIGVLTNPSKVTATTVTFDHSEIREVFKSRKTIGVSGYDPKGLRRVTNESHVSIAGRLIRWACEGPSYANWMLPMAMPPVGMSGNQSRTWHDYNMPTIEDELAEIQDDDGGPDIDFRPRVRPDGTYYLEPRLGNLDGPLLEWIYSASRSSLAELSLDGNGDQQANVIYATGDGSEQKLLVRSAWQTSSDTDMIALEVDESYSQLKSGSALQSHAASGISSRQKPVSDWRLDVRADGIPGVGELVLGQPHRVYTTDHPWIFDRWSDLRLVGFKGGLDHKITLQMQ